MNYLKTFLLTAFSFLQILNLIDASGGVNTPPEKMQAVMAQKQDEPWFVEAAEYFTRQPR